MCQIALPSNRMSGRQIEIYRYLAVQVVPKSAKEIQKYLNDVHAINATINAIQITLNRMMKRDFLTFNEEGYTVRT